MKNLKLKTVLVVFLCLTAFAFVGCTDSDLDNLDSNEKQELQLRLIDPDDDGTDLPDPQEGEGV